MANERTLSEALGEYFQNLTKKGVPESLAVEIVIDAAKAAHRGEMFVVEVQ